VLGEDGERVLCRAWRETDQGRGTTILAVVPASEHPTPSFLDRLAHEYELKDELDSAWAVRPVEVVRERGRIMLLLEDSGGEPLKGLLGAPMEVGRFLRLAIGIAMALGSELARGDDDTRAAATAGILKLVDSLAERLEKTKPEAAKKRFLAALSMMLGALTLSRIVKDPKLSDDILRQARKHVAEF
jgi:hypothetical protein